MSTTSEVPIGTATVAGPSTAAASGRPPATVFPPVPSVTSSVVVAEAPGPGPGNWAGGPSACLGQDGTIYLAYRLRRPIGQGRGYANVIAASGDGVHFTTLCVITRESLGAESLERPALVARPEGGWRLYVSCATPGTKHWRVVALDASHPEAFSAADARTVLPGDAGEGVKDPVVRWTGSEWSMWLCCHPLERPQDADRMWTRHARSDDGLEWTVGDVALAGRPGAWDARGARVAEVLWNEVGITAYYDGRDSAAANAEELTGLARGTAPDRLAAVGEGPVGVAPVGTGSLRYLSVLSLPGGAWRLYYEATRRDGAHDLRTEYVPPSR